jgi:competence protein ComEA
MDVAGRHHRRILRLGLGFRELRRALSAPDRTSIPGVELSRSQIAVYGAVAVALLLVGARALGQGERDTATASFGDASAEGSGSTLSVDQEGGRDVVVDVTGAVRSPGVYRMPAGSRVTDAIERAGGPEGRALLEQINQAARLADGQQVVVPERLPGAPAAAAGSTASEDGPISLGTASVEQLDTIEGIGPVTAGDIIEFRDQHGGLSSIEQLDEISGIGPATMEALRERLQP